MVEDALKLLDAVDGDSLEVRDFVFCALFDVLCACTD